jgi:subtilisin family serine protease
MQGIIGTTAIPDIHGPGRTVSPKCHGGDGYATCTSETPGSESVTAPSILQRDSHVKRTIGTDDETKPYIIVLKDQEGANALTEKDGGVETVIKGVGKVANLTRKDFEELKMNPHISSIEDDDTVTIAALTPYPELILSSLGQPSGENVPWGIEKVKAGDVPALPDGFEPIKVCVVDTGYGLGHPDLPQANVTGTDTVSGKWDEDGHGHGTHCAGTIGAIGGNDEGVVGVIKSPLEFTFHIGKGLSNSGSGSTSGVLAAVQ